MFSFIQENIFPADSYLRYSYLIYFRPVGRSYRSTRTTSQYANQLRLSGLTVGVTYEVTIRIELTVTTCSYFAFPFVYGEESDAINFTTVYTRKLMLK